MLMAILRLCFPLCYRSALFISLSFCLLSFIFALSFLQLLRVQMANLCAKIGRFLRAKKGVVKKFPGVPRPPSFFLVPGPMTPQRLFRLEPRSGAREGLGGYGPPSEHASPRQKVKRDFFGDFWHLLYSTMKVIF